MSEKEFVGDALGSAIDILVIYFVPASYVSKSRYIAVLAVVSSVVSGVSFIWDALPRVGSAGLGPVLCTVALVYNRFGCQVFASGCVGNRVGLLHL